MLNAIKNRGSTTRIWVRRINRKGKENAPVDSYAHFDKIVIPGDLIDANMEEMAEVAGRRNSYDSANVIGF